MNFYILSMERSPENREGHHYNLGVYSCLAQAFMAGVQHENDRAGKYEMRIELACLTTQTGLKEIPRIVALDYAVLKHPHRFNDKKQLLDRI